MAFLDGVTSMAFLDGVTSVSVGEGGRGVQCDCMIMHGDTLG